MKKILPLILIALMAVSTFAACGGAGQDDQIETGAQGIQGDKGDKGDEGRGILKTEIIDGCLWITYSDAPNSPVNVGKVSQDQNSEGEADTNEYGLDFYSLPDGTYGVMAGNSKYLEKIVIPEKYNGKAVTKILDNAFGSAPNLKELVIPDSVTSIGSAAFYGCSSLTSIEFKKTEGWKAGSTAISSTDLEDKGKAAEYLTDTYVSDSWTRS